MPITKPYYRIQRPTAGDIFSNPCAGYMNDPRFIVAREKSSLIYSAIIIVNDFLQLFEYIEPSDDHKKVYSHRIYELFLRTATEFEANCKGILSANHVTSSRNGYNIFDYAKLNQALHLSEYHIEFTRWVEHYYYRPFAQWSTEKGSLTW